MDGDHGRGDHAAACTVVVRDVAQTSRPGEGEGAQAERRGAVGVEVLGLDRVAVGGEPLQQRSAEQCPLLAVGLLLELHERGGAVGDLARVQRDREQALECGAGDADLARSDDGRVDAALRGHSPTGLTGDVAAAVEQCPDQVLEARLSLLRVDIDEVVGEDGHVIGGTDDPHQADAGLRSAGGGGGKDRLGRAFLLHEARREVVHAESGERGLSGSGGAVEVADVGHGRERRPPHQPQHGRHRPGGQLLAQWDGASLPRGSQRLRLGGGRSDPQMLDAANHACPQRHRTLRGDRPVSVDEVASLLSLPPPGGGVDALSRVRGGAGIVQGVPRQLAAAAGRVLEHPDPRQRISPRPPLQLLLIPGDHLGLDLVAAVLFVDRVPLLVADPAGEPDCHLVGGSGDLRLLAVVLVRDREDVAPAFEDAVEPAAGPVAIALPLDLDGLPLADGELAAAVGGVVVAGDERVARERGRVAGLGLSAIAELHTPVSGLEPLGDACRHTNTREVVGLLRGAGGLVDEVLRLLHHGAAEGIRGTGRRHHFTDVRSDPAVAEQRLLRPRGDVLVVLRGILARGDQLLVGTDLRAAHGDRFDPLHRVSDQLEQHGVADRDLLQVLDTQAGLEVVGEIALVDVDGRPVQGHRRANLAEHVVQLRSPLVAGAIPIGDHVDRGPGEHVGELTGERPGPLGVRGRDQAAGCSVVGVLLPLDDPHRLVGGDRTQHVGVLVEDGGESGRLLGYPPAGRRAEALTEPLVHGAVDHGLLADHLFDHGPGGVGVRVGRHLFPLRPGELVDVDEAGDAARHTVRGLELRLALRGPRSVLLGKRRVEQIGGGQADRAGDVPVVGVAREAVEQDRLAASVELHTQRAVSVAMHRAQRHELVAPDRLGLEPAGVESVPHSIDRRPGSPNNRRVSQRHPHAPPA